VTFTLEGACWKKDKSKTDITETKDKTEKANNTKHSRTKLAWFTVVASYDARPGNMVGLFYNAPEPTRG